MWCLLHGGECVGEPEHAHHLWCRGEEWESRGLDKGVSHVADVAQLSGIFAFFALG